MFDFDDETGSGEGFVVYGAEIVYDEARDSFEITNYTEEPVILGDVRRLEKKKK